MQMCRYANHWCPGKKLSSIKKRLFRASLFLSILKLPHKKLDMNKSTFFSGQPVLSQIIRLIPDHCISKLANTHKADRYCKTFKSRDHLVAMLYACFHKCTSLREVTTGLEASYNKLAHLNIKNIHRRSTLCQKPEYRLFLI